MGTTQTALPSPFRPPQRMWSVWTELCNDNLLLGHERKEDGMCEPSTEQLALRSRYYSVFELRRL